MRYRFGNHQTWLDPETTIAVETINGRVCVTANGTDISSWNVDGQLAQMPQAAAYALSAYLRYHLSQPNPVTELPLLAIIISNQLFWVADDCGLTSALMPEPPGYALSITPPQQPPFLLGSGFGSSSGSGLALLITNALSRKDVFLAPDPGLWRSTQSLHKEAKLLRSPSLQASLYEVNSIDLWFLVINATGAVFWRVGDCYVDTDSGLHPSTAYQDNFLSTWTPTTHSILDAVIAAEEVNFGEVVTVFDDTGKIASPTPKDDRTTTTYTFND